MSHRLPLVYHPLQDVLEETAVYLNRPHLLVALAWRAQHGGLAHLKDIQQLLPEVGSAGIQPDPLRPTICCRPETIELLQHEGRLVLEEREDALQGTRLVSDVERLYPLPCPPSRAGA